MANDVKYILGIYFNKKISIDRKIELVGQHFFKWCTKEVSDQYKYSKAVSFFIDLHNRMYRPLFDIQECSYYDSGFIVNLQQRDYRLVEKCAEEANKRYEKFIDGRVIKHDYTEFFRIWAENNHPSHNKKGNWKHSEIDAARAVQNQLKDEYPELYSLVRKYCLQYNCSVDLVCEVANKTLFLTPIGKNMYQYNLTNDLCIKIIKEYYAKTLVNEYTDIYAKISLIRSIMNKIALYIFRKKYSCAKGAYFRGKSHSRVLVDTEIDFTDFQDSNTICNYIFSIHNYTKLFINTNKNLVCNYLYSMKISNKIISNYIDVAKQREDTNTS